MARRARTGLAAAANPIFHCPAQGYRCAAMSLPWLHPFPLLARCVARCAGPPPAACRCAACTGRYHATGAMPTLNLLIWAGFRAFARLGADHSSAWTAVFANRRRAVGIAGCEDREAFHPKAGAWTLQGRLHLP